MLTRPSYKYGFKDWYKCVHKYRHRLLAVVWKQEKSRRAGCRCSLIRPTLCQVLLYFATLCHVLYFARLCQVLQAAFQKPQAFPHPAPGPDTAIRDLHNFELTWEWVVQICYRLLFAYFWCGLTWICTVLKSILWFASFFATLWERVESSNSSVPCCVLGLGWVTWNQRLRRF